MHSKKEVRRQAKKGVSFGCENRGKEPHPQPLSSGRGEKKFPLDDHPKGKAHPISYYFDTNIRK